MNEKVQISKVSSADMGQKLAQLYGLVKRKFVL